MSSVGYISPLVFPITSYKVDTSASELPCDHWLEELSLCMKLFIRGATVHVFRFFSTDLTVLYVRVPNNSSSSLPEHMQNLYVQNSERSVHLKSDTRT